MAEGEQISGDLVHALAKAGYEAGQASLTYPGPSWSELPTTDALVWMNAAEAIALALAAPAVVVSAEPVACGNVVTVPADKLAKLQRKAARYDWLRYGDNDEKALKFYPCPSVIADGKPTMFLLRNDALDAVIDAAIASTKPSKGAV